MQALPPRYVRSAILRNTTGATVTVKGFFQHDATTTWTLAPGQTVTVERSIDHGDWQQVDPLVKVSVHNEGDGNSPALLEKPVESTGGVKILNLNLTQDSNDGSFQLVEVAE